MPADRNSQNGVEVRPSWSPVEWAQVKAAAATVGRPLATWAEDELTGVLGAGPGPQACSQRGRLWAGLHERWQSMFWAAVALQPRVPAEAWREVGGIVGRVGLLIGAQLEDVSGLERRRAAAVTDAVRRMLAILGPGARRRAAGSLAATEGNTGRRRWKLLLPPPVHEALGDAARSGGWTCSDYAGAAVATAAALTLTDTNAATETALLHTCLTRSRVTAGALAAHLTTGTGPIPAEDWSGIARDLATIEAQLNHAPVVRGPAENVLDVRSAIPGAFATLGWAARWAGSHP